MEIVLRRVAEFPSQLAVPVRHTLRLNDKQLKQIKRDKDRKAALDELEDKKKKHDEKAILREFKQRFDADIGSQQVRDMLTNPFTKTTRLTNAEAVRAAMHIPASLAGINMIRGAHAMDWSTYNPPESRRRKREKAPEEINMATASDPEVSASSSLAMEPSRTRKGKDKPKNFAARMPKDISMDQTFLDNDIRPKSGAASGSGARGSKG